MTTVRDHDLAGADSPWDTATAGCLDRPLTEGLADRLRSAGERWPWELLDITEELVDEYENDGKPERLNDLVTMVRAGLDSDRLPVDLLGELAQVLGMALAEQARSCDRDDPLLVVYLDEAVRRLGVAADTTDDPEFARALSGEVGVQAYWLHAYADGEAASSALDLSIDRLSLAVAGEPVDQDHLWRLANAYEDRFVDGADETDRLRAVEAADLLLGCTDLPADLAAEVHSLRGRFTVDHCESPEQWQQALADLVRAREGLGDQEFGRLEASFVLAGALLNRGVHDEYESSLALDCLQDVLRHETSDGVDQGSVEREDLALMLAVTVGNRIWMSQRWDERYTPVVELLRETAVRPGVSSEVLLLAAVLHVLRATTAFIGNPREVAGPHVREGIRQLNLALDQPEVEREYGPTLHGMAAALWSLLITPENWSTERPLSSFIGEEHSWLDEPETIAAAGRMQYHLDHAGDVAEHYPWVMRLVLRLLTEPSWHPDEADLSRLAERQVVAQEIYALNGFDAFGGAVLVDRGTALRRADLVRAGIQMLEVVRTELVAGAPIRPHVETTLANARRALAELGATAVPGHADVPTTATELVAQAHVLRAGGRTREAISAGRAALRAHAGLLLSGATGPETGAPWRVAQDSGSLVVELVGWCRELDLPEQAVEVLEQGRALVLYATVSTGSVADRLVDARRPDLAARLTASGLTDEEQEQIRGTLMDSLAGQKMVMAPDPGEIGAALWDAQLDGIVYLVPPEGPTAQGLGVVVRPGGHASWLPLPSCTDLEPVEDYLAAYRAAFSRNAGPPSHRQWRQQLRMVCTWAHRAVAEPLLELTRTWDLSRTPRIALVPVGLLGAVPWAAARRAREDGLHHLVEEIVLSSAASARLLIDAARRPRLTPDSGVALVVNPQGDLALSSRAATWVRETFHPRARSYGLPGKVNPDGRGTPEQLLSVLPSEHGPGVGLLQISAHAQVLASSAETLIRLTGGSVLRVADILHQARSRPPGSEGGVVFCDCCATDVSHTDPDEALTLSTAFMAAGAVGVVGTRWPVRAGVSAVVTFMLHDRLAAGCSVPQALQEVQLWMRDPDRQPPAGAPPFFVELAGDPELTEEWAWAAYSAHGR